MEKQLIISVGREYGSGGHEIAEKLSKHYGIQLFDHNLLDEIAAKKNVNMDHLKELDERHKNPLSSRTVRGLSNSPVGKSAGSAPRPVSKDAVLIKSVCWYLQIRRSSLIWTDWISPTWRK